MESGPSARVRLLGGFELFDLDGEPIRINGRRARGLMAMLCLEGRGGLLRDRICGLLWGDRPDEQARGSLRQCLFELRSALGPRADALLDVGRERVAIRPGGLLTDIHMLLADLQAEDPERLAGVATQLASGPLLEGMDLPGPFQDWLDQARGAWESGLLDELSRRLAVLEAEGRWEAVRLLSEGYLRRDPLQESVAAAAIRSDVASGRAAAAQRRYLAIRQALSEDLGVAPGPELERAIGAGAQDAPSPALAAPPAAGRPAMAPQPAEPTLAVLAFENQSGDPGFLYFSDGISEEILHAVSQTTPLKIIGRSSSFLLRGAEKSAANVAARLGATHLLDGSVRRSGERVRITAQLVECASQTVLWSDRFDRELSDVFALHDDIAQAVAGALKSRFAPRGIGAVDPVALDLYLRARELRPDRLGYDSALLVQALDRVPDFASGWEALAYSEAVEARYGFDPARFGDHLARMEAAAERALALDPETVTPFRVRAMTAPLCGAYAESERLINLCLARRANDPLDLIHAGGIASSVGRNQLALAYAEWACELDPLDQVTFGVHAIYLVAAGRWSEARRQFDLGIRRWPDGGFLRSSAIVSAIRTGRRIHDNIRKALGFIFGVHVPIAGLAILPLATGMPVILGPLQIALLEMVIDPICALVFEAEREESRIMRRPPRDPAEPLFTRPLVLRGVVQGGLALLATGGLVMAAFHMGLAAEEVRTLGFFALVAAIIALVLANRAFSTSLGHALFPDNPALRYVALAVGGVSALILLVPPVQRLLGFAPLSLPQLGLVAAIGAGLLVVLEWTKPGQATPRSLS